MVRAYGMIILYFREGEDMTFDQVLFQYNKGIKQGYSGINNTFDLFNAPGSLGIYAPDIADLSYPSMIELTFPNGSESNFIFSVDSQPVGMLRDKDWVWFSVKPLRFYHQPIQ